VYQRALPHQGEPSSAGRPDSHPSWRPPAMGVLSEIDGQAPCYPASSQVVPIRERHRDGVNCGLGLGRSFQPM
jgi:hypothetical protein